MEFTSKIRWAIFITIGILFLILVSWGLYSIAQNLFSSNTDTNTVRTENIDKDIASDARTFSFRTIGPFLVDDEHRETLITVSANVIEMKVFQGYNDKVLESRSYKNNPEAFNEFRSALEVLDVSRRLKGTDKEDDNNDVGFCPTGRRYIVEINSEIRRWNTSCSAKQGTAAFSMRRVRPLFQKQVPDYREITKDVRL